MMLLAAIADITTGTIHTGIIATTTKAGSRGLGEYRSIKRSRSGSRSRNRDGNRGINGRRGRKEDPQGLPHRDVRPLRVPDGGEAGAALTACYASAWGWHGSKVRVGIEVGVVVVIIILVKVDANIDVVIGGSSSEVVVTRLLPVVLIRFTRVDHDELPFRSFQRCRRWCHCRR